MASIEKISVALPADMLGLVRAAVELGDYATTSEVIRDALREWKGRRETREEAFEEVRRLWREGRRQKPTRQMTRVILETLRLLSSALSLGRERGDFERPGLLSAGNRKVTFTY
jgi:antitoxin ParD1/3/4